MTTEIIAHNILPKTMKPKNQKSCHLSFRKLMGVPLQYVSVSLKSVELSGIRLAKVEA